MLKLENTETYGWEAAIRGMRNPKNSWDRSDSGLALDTTEAAPGLTLEHPEIIYKIGPNDHKLMMQLASGGPVHAKFRRMIVVTVDITAPLYWWKEFDTYKVGTVANSCSTMHKIHAKEFELDDFSHEHLFDWHDLENGVGWFASQSKGVLVDTVKVLNANRAKFLETGDKQYWWQMIQLLPSSYNQRRTVMLNYEVLAGIYPMRKDHKLDEWHVFCDWIKELPYSELIITPKAAERPIEEKTVITDHDRLVISAYTDCLLCDFKDYQRFVAETLGRPVYTHELASQSVRDELQKRLKGDILRIFGRDS